ncbi:MAG TPA: tRNA 2-thiouridine(34) synthase MnmA, partial [Candidatus Krumholzibacterium sp.]|nr:tRNA 2-thiouridine(34) synthase MnmA [Candidatus Krumholzibacterium sp.]
MIDEIIKKAAVRPPGKRGEAVAVGMSGGADSSVAAYLLREAGYSVTGLTLELSGEAGHIAGQDEALAVRAAKICEKLGILHDTFDVRELFDEKVRRTFVEAYESGRTPNPCVRCNETVKFPAIARYADSRGIPLIATGHYAALARVGGRVLLSAAADEAKDQTYFMYRVPVRLLERAVFPLGRTTKDEVRLIAARLGIDAHTGRESQDICFIPDGDTQAFLERYIRARSGDVVDAGGRVLGRHGGIHRYTIGQRKGLGISTGSPAYVTEIDAGGGRVVLSGENDLFSRTVICGNLKMRTRDLALPLRAKIRYRHPPAPIRAISVSGGRCVVTFEREQRAPTPGQSLVIYRDKDIIGGGIISGT